VLLTRTQKWSWLKAWGMQVARRRGANKAIVTLARRLAWIIREGARDFGLGTAPWRVFSWRR